LDQENRESHKMDEELCKRVRKALELEAIKPHASETLKDLLREDGRPEEERELTPEMREMVREYFYNFSKRYLQFLREEKSCAQPVVEIYAEKGV